MKITFIATVFNEEHTLTKFLDSLNNQSQLPDEIVIVDGGSNDNTQKVLKDYAFAISKEKVKIITKKGNRSVGRNEAIKFATGSVIVCSDSGNILDSNWIKQITLHFKKDSPDVVAGYYKGKAQSVFEKCLLPYALVMPNRVDPKTFLPATRSIAFTKKIWEKVGGFEEKLSHNEDYVFAHALRKAGVKIIFAKDALVYWIPRSTLKEAYIMFIRFAYGDAEAGIFRPKVLLIFARYILWVVLLFIATDFKNGFLFSLFIVTILLYLIWAIAKNYKYVKHPKAFFWLPILQITSDIAVLLGTIQGIFKVWDTKKML